MKKKKVTVIVIGVLVVLLALAVIIGVIIKNKFANSMNSNFGAIVEPVGLQDFSESFTVTGSAIGISKTSVSSCAQAEFTTISVSVGDEVKEGDVLAVLDGTKLEEQIADLETQIQNQTALAGIYSNQQETALQEAKDSKEELVAEAQKAVDEAVNDYNKANTTLAEDSAKLATATIERDQAKVNAQNAKNAWKSYEGEDEAKLMKLQEAYEEAASILAEKEATYTELNLSVKTLTETMEALQKAITTARNAYSATVKSADKAIQQAEEAITIAGYQSEKDTYTETLQSLKNQLEGCTIYAPCSGVVTAVNASLGDTNVADATFVVIEDTSKMKLHVAVDEKDIMKIEVGQEATITSEALGKDIEMTGSVSRVVRVKDGSTISGDGGNYGAEILIEDPKLLVGMTAKAKILLSKKEQVLSVPYDRVMTEGEQQYVLIAVLAEGELYTAKRVDLTIGAEHGYYAEVLTGDLKEGDLILLSDGYYEGDTFALDSYDNYRTEE